MRRSEPTLAIAAASASTRSAASATRPTVARSESDISSKERARSPSSSSDSRTSPRVRSPEAIRPASWRSHSVVRLTSPAIRYAAISAIAKVTRRSRPKASWTRPRSPIRRSRGVTATRARFSSSSICDQAKLLSESISRLVPVASSEAAIQRSSLALRASGGPWTIFPLGMSTISSCPAIPSSSRSSFTRLRSGSRGPTIRSAIRPM